MLFPVVWGSSARSPSLPSPQKSLDQMPRPNVFRFTDRTPLPFVPETLVPARRAASRARKQNATHFVRPRVTRVRGPSSAFPSRSS